MKLVGKLMAFLFVFCLVAQPFVARAQEYVIMPISSEATDASSETTISPRVDVIVMKYRVYNGVLQCRRWNETWGYWVDPFWIVVV